MEQPSTMDPQYRQFIAFGEEDVDQDPGIPQLRMRMSASEDVVFPTRKFLLKFDLRSANANRLRGPLCDRNALFYNTLFYGKLVLLHLTDDGPKRIRVPPLDHENEPATINLMEYWSLIEVGRDPPDRECELTANYQTRLITGERYALLWPGMPLHFWSWGSRSEHMQSGKTELMRRNENDGPKCILPADENNIITFKVVEEPFPWPNRPEVKSDAEWAEANRQEDLWRQKMYRHGIFPLTLPRKPSEKIPGVPVLTMTLTGPSEWPIDESIDITITVTYPSDAIENDKTITFNNNFFVEGDYGAKQNAVTLYRLVRDGDNMEKWEPYRNWSPYTLPFDFVPPFEREPPRPLSPWSQFSDRLTTLRPGESWSTKRQLLGAGDYARWDIPRRCAKPGEKFKYIFKGITVDWWFWGTKEEPLGEPSDPIALGPSHPLGLGPIDVPLHIPKVEEWEANINRGRPRILVAASNELELTVVE